MKGSQGVDFIVTACVIGLLRFTSCPLSAQPADVPEAVMVRAAQIPGANLSAVQPVDAASLPRAATYWSVQRVHYPPAPCNWLAGWVDNVQIYWLGAGTRYLIDDSGVDYDALAAAQAILNTPASPGAMMSMMANSLASSYAYGNPVYLTNMAASAVSNGTVTANFSIAGGTNFVPYDILASTNAGAPLASWNWIGIGYTSNRYSFSNQPVDQAFYILAKPQKTMVVGWGNDDVGQCDVPFGVTNAVMVAGGGGQSLALRSDGTVAAWGQNFYGEGSVPTNLAGVMMIAGGWHFDVALLTNGTVTAWGLNAANIGYHLTEVPTNLSGVTVISAQALHTLALTSNGTVVAWGYGPLGETSVPANLSNVVAISAGTFHSLAAKSDGTVAGWGYDGYGQCDAPAGLSNVVDVAAGPYHSLALLRNGTVAAWGHGSWGETNVPAGLSNVVAIAAGGDQQNGTAYSLALKSDGTVVAWGNGEVQDPVEGMTHVIALANGGGDHALAIRTGPPTPVITLLPVDQYKPAGSNATFTARGAGLYGVTYQWQFNGTNISGATNASLTVTNVQATNEGNYRVVVGDSNGLITSSNATLTIVTPPVITWQSSPTNIICIYGNIISLSASATAPGESHGFPLSYQWKVNGANIAGATTASYGFTADDSSSGIYSLIVTNAAGSASASWQVTVTNAINVTNDLLLIYNSNSADSSNLCAYYLTHRPMVAGANVLGVGCQTGEFFTNTTDWETQLVSPILNWLTNNPAKRPQYVILFYDIPSRLWLPGEFGCGEVLPQYFSIYTGSVSYHLRTANPTWNPFVTHINGASLSDCEAYVDKLAFIGTNYSPGQLIISASAGAYGNTNYCIDNARHGLGFGFVNGTPYGDGDFTDFGLTVSNAITGLIANGVSSNAIIYNDGLDTNGVAGLTAYTAPQITNAANVAGYICWGEHSALAGNYPTNGVVKWSGNSTWWIMETIESFNGTRGGCGQGNFIQWFSSNAFGGTNYLNTPVGAVSHTEEPLLPGVNDSAAYFGLWAAGKNFAICAWKSRRTPYFQAVGDPFVTR
jgi:alpha-tubulin suppressor-like RCC1 family protein